MDRLLASLQSLASRPGFCYFFLAQSGFGTGCAALRLEFRRGNPLTGMCAELVSESQNMLELIDNLQQLLIASWNVVVSLLALVLPWTPLLAWVAYWLFAVNWVKLREVIIQGGWIAVVLMGLMMVCVWGVVAPPDGGSHHLFGLNVTNFVGKTVYVTALISIMFLCGSVQLSGACGSLGQFAEPSPEEHSHDDHGSHGHDSHGHDSHGGDSHGHSSHDAHGH